MLQYSSMKHLWRDEKTSSACHKQVTSSFSCFKSTWRAEACHTFPAECFFPSPESDWPSQITYLRKSHSSLRELWGEREIYRMTVFQQQIQHNRRIPHKAAFTNHAQVRQSGISYCHVTYLHLNHVLKNTAHTAVKTSKWAINCFKCTLHGNSQVCYFHTADRSIWDLLLRLILQPSAAGTKLATTQIPLTDGKVDHLK